MKLVLVRHTTLSIEPGICYGQADVLPSATFETEAAEASKLLANLNPDKVFASPLKRCTLLAEACGYKDAIIEKRLIELDFGDWEMVPWNNIHGEYAQKWMEDYLTFPTPNGECLQDMIDRVEKFLDELKQQELQEVLCFTHSGPIRVFEHLINKIPVEKLFSFEVDYAGVYTYQI